MITMITPATQDLTAPRIDMNECLIRELTHVRDNLEDAIGTVLSEYLSDALTEKIMIDIDGRIEDIMIDLRWALINSSGECGVTDTCTTSAGGNLQEM